jgi:two-component system response regulator MprA
MGWRRAIRSAVVALALVTAVIVVAGNFVVVHVRLLGLGFDTRLAWAIVLPAAIGFAGGAGWSRSVGRVRCPPMTGPPTAGICEDDHELRQVIRRALEIEGFDVRPTSTGTEALRSYGADPPDVLVLDIGLPDADGRDVCQALRAQGVGCPVLFLTAKSDLTDRLSGFHAGGDDYLGKPFALSELLVRVHALHRRSARAPATPEHGFVLDAAAHAIVHGKHRVRLTPTEFRLLAVLAARPGEVVRRGALVAAGWPDGAVVHDNTLDAYLARIRRKLRAARASVGVTTARGIGYTLQ